MQTRILLSLLAAQCATLAAEVPVATFKAVDVDTKVQIGYGVTVADVNGDKKPDILLADKNLIVWYENPSWAKHVMAENLTPQDHVCIAAQDIDGDGKCEVAVGAGWNPGDTLNSGAVFYLVPPADRTQKWEPVPLPHEPTVHRMRWVQNDKGAYNLVMVPLHGRGNKPATGEGAGVKVIRYQKPANVREPWKVETLDESMHKTHNFDPIQWDADAAQEMLVGGKEGVFLMEVGPGAASMTQISGTESGGAGEVRAGQLGAGKRFVATVEPMHGNNLVLYTPPSSGADAKKLWNRTLLDESLIDGHALACGDLSGLGRDQIVVGWRAMNRPTAKVGIKLFTPVDAEGTKWQQTLIDDNTMACEDLCLADLDGNGKLDIVAAGRATKNLKIYLNQGVK
ncbi:MAG: VCBS repeat-containing protein [Verrucomicrobia bacterium]|nr:VCBS repeat-containing protein [Verrucomicrobiota bacterium]